MKRLLLLAPVFALTAFLAPSAADEAEVRPHEQLHATLYAQSAAEYRALCYAVYASARLQLDAALADKAWTACLEQQGDYSGKPPAVILDADETVLDNSAYQARLIRHGGEYDLKTWLPWCREKKALAVPGAVEFCRYAADKGCTVFYVTNRDSEVRDATRDNLRALGFPLRDEPQTVLTRDDTSDKSPRRRKVCEGYRVLLQVGDQLTDFAGDFNKQPREKRAALVEKHRDWFGTRWHVLPNVMYGDWEASLFGYEFRLSPAQKLARKLAALEGVEPLASPGVISAGPMAAYSEMTETAIWLQTNAEAAVVLRYWPKGSPGLAAQSAEVRAHAGNDHIALVRLTGLSPGTRFDYEVLVNGARASFDFALEFQTQPIWRWRGDAPDFTFTLGSCMYVNDPPFDRPGKPYGGDFEILPRIAAERPDFMLWMGDNIYLREPDWVSESGIRYRYRHSRALKELQPLLAACHHYATWDDHDFGPNDSDRGFRLKQESLRVFKEYFPGVSYGTSGVEGCFSRFEWGDCEFFLLDDRYWRAPNKLPGRRDYLGAGQLQWLKDGLISSTATFKFIVNGNQMFNPAMNFESFGLYPEEQRDLLDFLTNSKVPGVVVLTGDRHASELLKIEREGSYPLYEYTSSPLTSGAGRYEPEAANQARVPGTWVTGTRNYGKIQVSGKKGERTLTLTAHDKTGKELWRHELREKDLR